MKLSTPFLIGKTLLIDLLTKPHFIKMFLTKYINERSFSHSIGNIKVGSLFDFVPDASCQPVSFQSIFEIPTYPCNKDFERTYYKSATTLADSFALAHLARVYSQETIIEVGTSFGHSTLTLALNSPENCKIHTLDIQTDNPTIGEIWRNSPSSSKIHQHIMSLSDIENDFPKQSVDMIFIDGDHTYAGSIADTRAALRLIRPGGLIAWHDYSFRFRDGVVRALDEIQREKNLCIKSIAHTNLTAAKINC